MLLCHIPDYCYHQQELPKLTCLIGNNSASFLYSHRRILVDLEYIQIRQSGSALHRRTEYRLVPFIFLLIIDVRLIICLENDIILVE